MLMEMSKEDCWGHQRSHRNPTEYRKPGWPQERTKGNALLPPSQPSVAISSGLGGYKELRSHRYLGHYNG